MTIVHVRLARGDGATYFGSLTMTPTRRHALGTTLVTEAAYNVALNGTALTDIDMAPTASDWCWHIQENVPGGAARYVAVPGSGPVEYEALVDVDPKTLSPAALPEAAWWAALDNVATGTVTMPQKFYVSAAGSNSADGLSPTTAKQTLGGVAAALPGSGAAEITVMSGATTEAGSVTFSIPVTLVGIAGGTNTGLVGSRIVFPAGSSGIIFASAAQMSELRSVSIESLSTGSGTDDGVNCARSLKFSQVQIKGFGRYGINGDSTSKNMNFVHGDVRITGCYGDGIRMNGTDSNQWDLSADISACGGWGWNVAGALVFGLNAQSGQVTNCALGAVKDVGYGNYWNVVDAEPVVRTIAAGSNGLALPQTTVSVSTTVGLAPSGLATITTGAGAQTVTYSGVSGGNTLTGCTGGTGTMSTGGNVQVFPLVDISAANGSVWWHPSRVDQRDVAVTFTPSQRVYQGQGWVSRLSLLGPGGPLQGQVWSFTNGSAASGMFTLDNDTASKRALDIDVGVTRLNMQIPLQTAVLVQPRAAQTLSSNGAVTINAASGDAVITLAANATSSTITNPQTDQILRITWIQDATGGRTYVWPTTCVFVNGRAPADTTPSRRSTVQFRYDGTNWQEMARPDVVLSIVRTTCPPATALSAFTANTSWFYRVIEGGTITKLRIQVGTQSGNIGVAAYSNTGAGLSAIPGTQLATSGSIACPATGVQDVALGSAVTLAVGDWVALGADNATATFGCVNGLGAGTLWSGQMGQHAVFPPSATPSLSAANNRMFTLIGVP